VLKDDAPVAAIDVVKAAINQQLLLVPAGPQVVRMVPALVITRREVNSLLNRLDATLAHLST
jgi:acetylornithine aminotransferase